MSDPNPFLTSLSLVLCCARRDLLCSDNNMASSLPSRAPEASVWATMLTRRPIVILIHTCTAVFSNSNYSAVKTLLILYNRSLNVKSLTSNCRLLRQTSRSHSVIPGKNVATSENNTYNKNLVSCPQYLIRRSVLEV